MAAISADPVSAVASTIEEAITAAMAVHAEFNTQPIIDAAVAGALEAMRAKIADDIAKALAPGASPETLKAVQEDAAT